MTIGPLSPGLFSRGVAKLESYPFIRGVGGDVSESGEGPGSYDVRGNVWHFNGPGLSPDIKTNVRSFLLRFPFPALGLHELINFLPSFVAIRDGRW
jgi:hypothetical protein